MIHARKDYNRIQDPENKIGKYEPVFIVRAQDKHMISAMNGWAISMLNEASITNNIEQVKMANIVLKFIDEEVVPWQQENGCKTPDM